MTGMCNNAEECGLAAPAGCVRQTRGPWPDARNRFGPDVRRLAGGARTCPFQDEGIYSFSPWLVQQITGKKIYNYQYLLHLTSK